MFDNGFLSQNVTTGNPVKIMPPDNAIYRPLSRESCEIRVLVLRPAVHKSTQLICSLIHVDLRNVDHADGLVSSRSYEALSYTWGNPSDTTPCDLNGLPHQITKNLEAALKQLRWRSRSRYLWVDALCINQQDTLERNHQVPLMKRIYESAARTLVWLGPPSPDSDTAMNLLSHVANISAPNEYVAKSLMHKADQHKWEAVARLISRPWFRRVWIRQEVAVAQDIDVLCGSKRLQWDIFMDSCDVLIAHFEDPDNMALQLRSLARAFVPLDTLGRVCAEIKVHDRLELEYLVSISCDADASDARDKVYGMLALAGDQVTDIPVDYRLTASDVFKHTTIALLKPSQSLDPLSMCQWSDSRPSNMPSWTVNLGTPFTPIVLRDNDIFRASGDSRAEFKIDEGLGILKTRGYIVDRVQWVGQEFPNSPRTTGTWDNWAHLAVTSLSLSKGASKTQNRDMLDEYRRTLLMDQDPEGCRASKDVFSPLAECATIHDFTLELSAIYEQGSSPFATQVREVCLGRALLGTLNQKIGLGSPAYQEGDLVCLLFGAGVPFILRKEGQKFISIGEACK